MDNKQPPWHFGVSKSNTRSEWLPTDSPERFARLVEDPAHREYFAQHGWLEPGAITYNINSNGFRCDEFNTATDSIVALGCSYTVGIGLPLKDIWPTLVGNALGLTVYNLAWGGNSADTCFRLAEYWVPRLNPKLVVMLTPPPARLELIALGTSNPVEVFLPSEENGHSYDIGDYVKQWFVNDENSRLNNLKNKLAVRQLCGDLDIACLTYDAFDYMSQNREVLGYARDHMHAGVPGHRRLADKILRDHSG